MHDNWSGLIMDGSQENMDYVKQDNICWMHDLKPVPAFITAENINTLIRDNGFYRLTLMEMTIGCGKQ